MNDRFLALRTAGLAAITMIAAIGCGGGGGGSTAVPAPTSAPPGQPVQQQTPTVPVSPAPTPTSSPSGTGPASVSGSVVDFASNTPLGGVNVALAPYTHGAAAVPQATTAPNGTFSFATTAGIYLLVIGSDVPSDTRTTIHQRLVVNPGSNPLAAATAKPEPNVTPFPSQLTSNFRLTSFSGDQLDCFNGANRGRAGIGLNPLVPDEYATETANATAQEAVGQDTDTPLPMFRAESYVYASALGSTGLLGLTDEENFVPCSAWTGPNYSYVSGNPPYPFATDPGSIWYGVSILPARSIQINYGQQLWLKDPR